MGSELVSVISFCYDRSDIEIFCCNTSASKPSKISAGGGGPPGEQPGEQTGEQPAEAAGESFPQHRAAAPSCHQQVPLARPQAQQSERGHEEKVMELLVHINQSNKDITNI